MQIDEYPILVEQLCPGLFIRIDAPGLSLPFPAKGFKIANETEISRILSLGLDHVLCVPDKSDRLPIPIDEIENRSRKSQKGPWASARTPVSAELSSLKRETIERNKERLERFAACERRYEKAMAGLARAAPEEADDSLDFGCVDAIAGDAFFGASLWMIVKSLTSPFKSVIKFGLLEKYAAEGGEPVLLCEMLKEHILTRQGGLWRCDPYALLFSEVSRHYRERESAGVLELLRQAFLQKTGLDPCEDYRTRAGEAILDHFFPYAPPAGTCPSPPKREAPAGDGSFAQIVALGDAITTYLLRAYERLKQRGTALAGAGGLSERDQTMCPAQSASGPVRCKRAGAMPCSAKAWVARSRTTGETKAAAFSSSVPWGHSRKILAQRAMVSGVSLLYLLALPNQTRPDGSGFQAGVGASTGGR